MTTLEITPDQIRAYLAHRRRKHPGKEDFQGGLSSFEIKGGTVEVKLEDKWSHGRSYFDFVQFPLAHLSLTEAEREAIWEEEEDGRRARELSKVFGLEPLAVDLMIKTAQALDALVLGHIGERARAFPKWLDLADIKHLSARTDFDIETGMADVTLHGSVWGQEWGTSVDVPISEFALDGPARMAIWQAEEDRRLAAAEQLRQKEALAKEAREKAELSRLLRRHGLPTEGEGEGR